MEFKDALTIFFERSTAMQTYWNFYVTIVLAYIAFFGSIKPSPTTRHAATLLTAGFLVFAVVNLEALLDVTRQRWVLRELLVAQPPVLEALPDANIVASVTTMLTPPRVIGVIAVHVIGDILTLIAIWYWSLRNPLRPN